ncbi:hypothetical protein JXJ21_19950 [candidate division KSB1 bacterium]|nr:hypothetical protein [candidate division KSB1 bacterium]
MKMHLDDVSDFIELELHLMAAALYFCDFSVVYPLFNKESVAVKAFQTNDLIAAKNILSRYYALDGLSETEIASLDTLYKELEQAYSSRLQSEQLPLPKEFLVALGNRAVENNKFGTANTVYRFLNNLDKRINEIVDSGIQQLKSKEFKDALSSSEKEQAHPVFEARIQQAAAQFYKAMRLLHPISLGFQNIGVEFVLNDKLPLRRRLDRYVEQAVLRELLLVGFEYLIYEKSIYSKLIDALDTIQASGKLMRQLLKELAILYSGGEENYSRFIRQYNAAVDFHQNAESEIAKIETQAILLGRSVGDDNFFQYLKEIVTQFPLSALVVTCLDTSINIKYIAPKIAKSTPLLELLGLEH